MKEVVVPDSCCSQVLYNHDNARFHRVLNIFAVAQFFFWMYTAQFAATTLRDIPVNKDSLTSDDLPWYRKINLGENKFRNGITILCVTVGSMILGGSWMYALKTVQTIVLRKGGKHVTFITHGPFNKLRYLHLPVDHVSIANVLHFLIFKIRTLFSTLLEILPIQTLGWTQHVLFFHQV